MVLWDEVALAVERSVIDVDRKADEKDPPLPMLEEEGIAEVEEDTRARP
jgi:hypothetical protein